MVPEPDTSPPAAPSLTDYLRDLPAGVFQARLEAGREVAKRCHEFYPNEIAPAEEFVKALRRGARSVLVGSPMQSGKTNIMGGIMVMCHELTRQAPERFRPRGVYICANNQIDFRSQSMSSLCHHMQVLTLRDRRRWVDTADTPLIVFYDESHFGDGVRMTINDFLSRHDVFGQHHNMIFCGVSATPWSAMGSLDAEIIADVSQLESLSYNSVGMMLERGRIVEADPLFVDENGIRITGAHANTPSRIYLNQRSNAYRHIERIMERGEDIDGYCVIRCLKHQGKKLLSHLQERYGNRIYAVEWNQHQREFNADFFKSRRYGRFTVVVVQHKARMGNRINTKYIHFFHEMSPSAHVDTLAQSFIGRACGFHKQDHETIVYSHVPVAEIYDACMGRSPDMQRFSDLCEQHRKKPALRAEIVDAPKGFEIIELETVEFPRGKNPTRALVAKVQALKLKYLSYLRGNGIVRQMSKWSRPEVWRTASKVNGCRPDPGSWSISVYDCELVGDGARRRVVASPTIRVTLWLRTDRKQVGYEPGIRSKENSLFCELYERQAAKAAQAHSPPPPRPLRPADSDLEANVAAAAEGPKAPVVDVRWQPRPKARRLPARLPAVGDERARR